MLNCAGTFFFRFNFFLFLCRIWFVERFVLSIFFYVLIDSIDISIFFLNRRIVENFESKD